MDIGFDDHPDEKEENNMMIFDEKDKEIQSHPEMNKEITPELLIQQAIDKNVPIETMEKLLAMWREIKEAKEKELYYKALSKFQSICPIIEKRKIVYNSDKTERYRYAPIEDILEQIKISLMDCGISYDFDSVIEDGKYTSVCSIHHVGGYTKKFTLPVPIENSKFMSSIQSVGTARTYSNRYVFENALGIMTSEEDNDANIGNEQKEYESPKENFQQMWKEFDKLARNHKEYFNEDLKNKIIEIYNNYNTKKLGISSLKEIFEKIKNYINEDKNHDDIQF